MNIINRFTIRTLWKNKIRTLVTVIGIALSAAMFTGVTSLIVSFQQYLVNLEIAGEGAWEGELDDISGETVAKIKKDKEIRGSTTVANLGYAYERQSKDESKPYLFVAGIESDFQEYSVVNLVEGRMPKNSSEVVIPENLLRNERIDYAVGDTLKLKLGQRVFAGGEEKGDPVGGQNTALISEQGGEELTDFTERTFQVVGICERLCFEPFSAPGYTLLTQNDGQSVPTFSMLMMFQDATEADHIMNKYLKEEGRHSLAASNVHGELLRFQGKSTNSVYNKVLYSMGAVLIGIIMLGSISLIYNAFSISVSERTKQFGLLKSVGATKKQIRNSVFFEVLVLSILGIPLGLLAGLGGIAVTLHFVEGILRPMLSVSSAKPLGLVVTMESVLISVFICLFTVLISAWIPARKAVKLPAIQSLRQSTDIRIRRKRLKTSRLTMRLFGFEGMIASKNFKRNRRKYRATVLSLFMSIILFVTATSFSSYMTASMKSIDSMDRYDVSCTVSDQERKGNTIEGIGESIRQLSGVKECAYAKSALASVKLPLDQYNEEYLKIMKNTMDQASWKEIEQEDGLEQVVQVYFLEDDVFEDYLEKKQLDQQEYMNTKLPEALIWDRVVLSTGEGVFSGNILKEAGYHGKVTLEDYDENGKLAASVPLEIGFGTICQGEVPLGIDDLSFSSELAVVLPYRYMAEQNLQEKLPVLLDATTYQIRTPDHKKVVEELTRYMSDEKQFGRFASDHIFDQAETREVNQATVMIVDIFAYGFIVLITLISLANVFNTVSTNIALRRQEFAMLKSVGMTQTGFHRMMNYECILFGLKSLLLGIPVSLLINELMHQTLNNGINASRIIPWQGVLISSISVFLVVFLTMLYSFGKIRKDNPIEALRNENL